MVANVVVSLEKWNDIEKSLWVKGRLSIKVRFFVKCRNHSPIMKLALFTDLKFTLTAVNTKAADCGCKEVRDSLTIFARVVSYKAVFQFGHEPCWVLPWKLDFVILT